MQKHYNYLNIDLDKKIHTKLKAKQGDSKSRYILVNLISNSTYYDLSDCAVKIYGIKKDKTIFFNHATVINGKQGQFEVELTAQALSVPGEIEIQILILGTNQEKLTTFSFFIDVEKTIIDDTAIESTNEFTALTKALSSVQNIDNKFAKVDEQFNAIMNSVTTILGVKNDGSEDISLKLFEYAKDKDFLYLYFPQGVYRWDNNIILTNKKIKFIGDNARIEHYNNVGHALKIGDTETHNVDDFYFSGIEFINKRKKSASDIGGITNLIVSDAQNVTIKDTKLLHAEQYGLQLREKNGIIKNCCLDNVIIDEVSGSLITTSSIALETLASSGDGYIDNLTISNCHFEVKDTYIDKDGYITNTTVSNACKLQACNNVTISNTKFVGGKENGTLSFIYDTKNVKMVNVSCKSNSLISKAITITNCPDIELLATNCELMSDNFSQTLGLNGGFKSIKFENCKVGRITKVSGTLNNLHFNNCEFYTKDSGMTLSLVDSSFTNCYFSSEAQNRNIVITSDGDNISLINFRNVDTLEISGNNIKVVGGDYANISPNGTSSNCIIQGATIINSYYCIRFKTSTCKNYLFENCIVKKVNGDNFQNQLAMIQGDRHIFSNNSFIQNDISFTITYPVYINNSNKVKFIETQNIFTINKTANYNIKSENSTELILYRVGDMKNENGTMKVYDGTDFVAL